MIRRCGNADLGDGRYFLVDEPPGNPEQLEEIFVATEALLRTFEEHVPQEKALAMFVCLGCKEGMVHPASFRHENGPIVVYTGKSCQDCCPEGCKGRRKCGLHPEIKAFFRLLEDIPPSAAELSLGGLAFPLPNMPPSPGSPGAAVMRLDKPGRIAFPRGAFKGPTSLYTVAKGVVTCAGQITPEDALKGRLKIMRHGEMVVGLTAEPGVSPERGPLPSDYRAWSSLARGMETAGLTSGPGFRSESIPPPPDDLAWNSMKDWKWVKDRFPEPLPRSFQQFAKLIPGRISWPNMGKDLTEDLHLMMAMYTMGRWADAGLNIFELTHSFMAAMLLTDPSGIPCSAVHLPFQAFYLRLPTPFWTMVMSCGAEEPVSGLWVVSQPSAANETLPTTVIVPCTTNGSGMPNLIASWDSTPEWSIGQWVTSNLAERRVLDGSVISDKTALLLGQVLRLVVNLCLYLSEIKSEPRSENAGPVSKNRKAKKPLPREGLPVVTVLSRTIKLDKDLIEAARHLAKEKKGRKGAWRTLKRFVVRGHWKNQVFGTRKRLPNGGFTPWTERRYQWQQPFWKGDGSILQHVYRLTDGKGDEDEK